MSVWSSQVQNQQAVQEQQGGGGAPAATQQAQQQQYQPHPMLPYPQFAAPMMPMMMPFGFNPYAPQMFPGNHNLAPGVLPQRPGGGQPFQRTPPPPICRPIYPESLRFDARMFHHDLLTELSPSEQRHLSHNWHLPVGLGGSRLISCPHLSPDGGLICVHTFLFSE